MTSVASRELRNNTRELLDLVQRGEAVTITVAGQPVAILQPLEWRPTWLSRDVFVREVLRHQADPALAGELRLLSAETTDDLPLL